MISWPILRRNSSRCLFSVLSSRGFSIGKTNADTVVDGGTKLTTAAKAQTVKNIFSLSTIQSSLVTAGGPIRVGESPDKSEEDAFYRRGYIVVLLTSWRGLTALE